MKHPNFIDDFHRMTNVGWSEADGVNRLALNNYDILARSDLEEQLNALNAAVKHDDAGNIYGSLGEGEKETISIGSHMDSVPNGGRYDGFYGVVSALQVMKDFNGSGLRKGLTLIDFTNEEGSRFQPSLLGSGLATGVFKKEFVYSRKDDQNRSFGEVLEKTSFLGSSDNRIKRQDPDYYLELHIEQGPVLEKEGISIGIPKGIVTLIVDRYSFEGESNQAGPTPMDTRKDALVAASRFVSGVRDMAKKRGPDLVMTVGKIQNLPNAYNVIPSKVSLNLDTRSPEKKTAEEYSARAKELASSIADEEGVLVRQEKLWITETTLFDEDLTKEIEKACKNLGFDYKFIYSWPGHDAQYMNRITRTAMIMIPSHNGRSHTKEEFSTDEDLVKGLKVLEKTVETLVK